jgi:glycosyltransferase involved in cell wall biosynthesis
MHTTPEPSSQAGSDASGHQASDFTYSIVVPVYNSAGIVGTTVDEIVATMEGEGLKYELVLVNDGSHDNSWEVIADRARRYPHVTAIRLLKNYGQHNANLAGLRASTGDYVITMDDDLQNPPDQIRLLIDKVLQGHDVVFGEFETKRAAPHRRMGSKLIGLINRRVFSQPPDLVVSNFRIMRRDVVDRICAASTPYPYITGQALMYSSRQANVVVRHEPRAVGRSTYGTLRIVRLVLTILFSYSVFPLRLAAALGFVIALFSMALGVYFLFSGWVFGARVPGWTTLVVLVASLNGVIIALLSMLGEYVIRTLNTVSSIETYHVVEQVSQ